MAKPTLIHLQMGQDVLYIVLSFFVLAAVVLTVVVLQLSPKNVEAKIARSNKDVAFCLSLRQARVRPARGIFVPRQGLITASDLLKCDKLLASRYMAAQVALVASTRSQTNDQPPIIMLREADGYFFPSGSSVVSDTFRQKLATTIVPRLVELSARYHADIIEVVGHTDEQPVRWSSQHSTLDGDLLDFVQGRSNERPVVSDNVGLGMARAVAVVRILRSNSRLSGFDILPLSGGQVIMPGDRLATGLEAAVPVQERRRIEIRLRRRK